MKPIDKALLDRFIDGAIRSLSGDWVVMGGAVLPLVGVRHRVTYDIDIAGPEHDPQTLEVLQLAASLGLPVEAVNPAGAFFLRRVDGWHDHLLPVRVGTRSAVFRPDATLYTLTKLSRLSESDLSDCIAYLDFAASHGEPLDAPRLRESIRGEVRRKPSAPRRRRLDALVAALGSR